MSNLLQLRDDLSNAGGNFMAPLRESEFLSAIKHRSAIPAAPAISTCPIIPTG